MVLDTARRQLRFTPDVAYASGTSSGARTAWILSYSGVSHEPRVIRQASALLGAGWRVLVLGYDGHSPRPREWHYACLPPEGPGAILQHYLLAPIRWLGLKLARAGPTATVRESGARLYHANVPKYRLISRAVNRFQSGHPELRPDLVISHDYFAADVGYSVARSAGARLMIDCHEYARGQYMHDPRWVERMRPYVVAIQDYYLERADAVTTVCEGIADLLNRDQALRRPVEVIRSVPFRDSQPFRPTGDRITVLYHGVISYVRGLHKAVQSLPLWRPEFELVLRGSGDPAYIGQLRSRARELGVADRFRIEPPVPFAEIVPAANQEDIGYFVHKDMGPQKRFALPNKFFEYVMAGLALCVSDLPEMSRLVHRYGFGKLVPEYDVQAIAEVINSFDRATINDMKKKSLAAATELNWEAEQGKLLSLIERIT